MPGLSDIGLYQRTILVFHGEWSNVKPGQVSSSRAAPTEPLVAVALDLSQGFWIARGSNWQLARSHFLGGRFRKRPHFTGECDYQYPKG